jgi:agmatinase
MASAAVRLVGIPSDSHSSFRRGAALAPAHIRAAWRSPATNSFTELGVDLAAAPLELGVDLDLPDGLRGEAAVGRIADGVAAHLGPVGQGARVLCLGGDHFVTWPILRAHHRRYGALHVVHFDAHPDLYDNFDGDRHSHACPFARICEERLAASVLQIGVRTATSHQRDQAARFGVRQLEARGFGAGAPELPLPSGPTDVSLDLDVLEPGLMPGLSHPEPGGLSVRQVIDLLHRIPGPIVGADVVELNPTLDPTGLGAIVAARLARELAGRLLEA